MKRTILLITILFGILFFQKVYSQENKLLTFVKSITGYTRLNDLFINNPKFSITSDDYNLGIYNEDFSLYNIFKVTNLVPDAIGFVDLTSDKLGDKRIVTTQTLFNDDDLLEFVVYGNNFFTVVNEKGKELFRETISGEGETFGHMEGHIVEIGSKVYLSIYITSTATHYGDLYRYYEINK